MDDSFNSDYRVERMVLAGTSTIPDTTFSTVTADHDLGYIPFIRYFVEYPDGKHVEGTPIDPEPASPDLVDIQVTLSTTQIEFSTEQYTGAELTVYWRVYTEEVE